jgi:hypothetical protein
MGRIFILAIFLFGLTAAQSQTSAQVNGQTGSSETGTTAISSDPLSVPASTNTAVITGSSSTAGSSAAASAGAASIAASAANTSQSPLELPGEGSDTSTQAAGSSAAAPSGPPSICGPAVPTTDGGSANIDQLAGGVSIGGC